MADRRRESGKIGARIDRQGRTAATSEDFILRGYLFLKVSGWTDQVVWEPF